MLPGRKIEGLSLRFMTGKRAIATCLILWGGALCAAPQESLFVQEMRQAIENLGHQLRSHGIDINLFQERLQALETLFKSVKQDLKSPGHSVEKRLTLLEKANEAIASDMKTLKNHFNETASALNICQSQLSKIDKQLTSDIQTLKASLNSMLSILQPTSPDKTYTVQSGDSLRTNRPKSQNFRQNPQRTQ